MKRRIAFAALLILGLAGFVAIPFIVGVDRTLAAVGDVGVLGIAMCVLNSYVVLFIPAITWWILMRGAGIACPPWTLIKANLMGFPLVFFTPSMYLGGEPVKAIYVANKTGQPRGKVLATIIVAKVQEFVGLTLVTVICVWMVTWRQQELERRDELALILAAAIFVAALLVLLWAILGRWHLSVKIINVLNWFGFFRKRAEHLRAKAIEMEGHVREAFTHRFGTFMLAQIVVLLSAASIFVRPWLFHVWSGGDGGMKATEIATIYLITNIANTVQVIPGNLGFLEGGLVAYMVHIAGMPEARVAAFLVVNRIADLAFLMVGSWFLLRAGMKRWWKEPPPPV